MKKPTLPPHVQFHEDVQLFVWKLHGPVNEAVVNKVISFLGHTEAVSRRPFNRFTDLSAQEAAELSFKYIFHVSLYRRLSCAGRPPVKSAFLVTTPEAAHLVKIHVMMTDHSPLQVEMFEERDAAAKWLGVPVEALQS